MTEPNHNETQRAATPQPTPRWLDFVRAHIASLRFGTVLITVHDGRVVQVEKSEKVRLDQPDSPPARLAPGAGGLSTPVSLM